MRSQVAGVHQKLGRTGRIVIATIISVSIVFFFSTRKFESSNDSEGMGTPLVDPVASTAQDVLQQGMEPSNFTTYMTFDAQDRGVEQQQDMEPGNSTAYMVGDEDVVQPDIAMLTQGVEQQQDLEPSNSSAYMAADEDVDIAMDVEHQQDVEQTNFSTGAASMPAGEDLGQQQIAAHENGGPVQILCLGDSITAGGKIPFSDRPVAGAYRHHLASMLKDENRNVEFVGDVCKPCKDFATRKPECSFGCDDPDADRFLAYWAWQTSEIVDGNGPENTRIDDDPRSGLKDWIEGISKLDIVMIHLGTNDLSRKDTDTIVADYCRVFEVLRAKFPSVKIILAQIIPIYSGRLFFKVKELNAKIVELAADPAINTEQSPLYVADCFTDFDVSTMLVDNVHPNQKGAQAMARSFHKVLTQVLDKFMESPPDMLGSLPPSPATGLP